MIKPMLIIVLGMFLQSCSVNSNESLETTLVKLAQQAYADGQYDALHEDVRIKMVNDSQAIFEKSPWSPCDDSGMFRCNIQEIYTVKHEEVR
jgi:hypothetical protein